MRRTNGSSSTKRIRFISLSWRYSHAQGGRCRVSNLGGLLFKRGKSITGVKDFFGWKEVRNCTKKRRRKFRESSFLRGDIKGVLAGLRRSLDSPEHSAFV